MMTTHSFKRIAHFDWQAVTRWLLRFSLVLLLCVATAHRPVYVVLGEPQTVETEHPILCVHTRLTDEVDEWKIQRTLQMVREMGATAITEFFPWAYMEPEEGVYWWGHADMVIEHANAQGLMVIARVGMVPRWAHPEGPDDGEIVGSLNHLESERYQDFADFLELFAARYQGSVDHIIVWNEPNLAFEWGFQEVDPQNYISLMRVAAPAIHRGNPDAVVLAGALAPTLEPTGSPNGMNDILYLRALYEAGFAETYDALAIHTYGFRFPPDDPPAPDVLNFRRAEMLREIMVEYGDGGKPVFITEAGWNDHPRWTKAVRPGQRISYTIDGVAFAESNWSWVENVCIWAFRYPRAVHNWPDYFTLVSPDFTAKPIYYELQAWARGWVGDTQGRDETVPAIEVP